MNCCAELGGLVQALSEWPCACVSCSFRKDATEAPALMMSSFVGSSGSFRRRWATSCTTSFAGLSDTKKRERECKRETEVEKALDAGESLAAGGTAKRAKLCADSGDSSCKRFVVLVAKRKVQGLRGPPPRRETSRDRAFFASLFLGQEALEPVCARFPDDHLTMQVSSLNGARGVESGCMTALEDEDGPSDARFGLGQPHLCSQRKCSAKCCGFCSC